MKEFLRECPSCGRRFVLRVLSKNLVDRQSGTERIVHDIVSVAPDGPGGAHLYAPPNAATVEEVPIQRETFDVALECRHCHHKWTEVVNTVERS